MSNQVKKNELLELLKEWKLRAVNALNEEAAIQRFIERIFKDRILKIIKKGALFEEIPIDINGRQYLINIPDLSIEIRDDENKYFWYLYSYKKRYCKRYERYKNYSQQYKDFGLILNALDQYLDNKAIPEWNTVEKVEEAIQFVEDFKKKYVDHLGYPKSREFIFVGDEFSEGIKIFMGMNYNDFLPHINLYKNILLSDDIPHNFFDEEFRWTWRYLNKISYFLSNFELNKKLLSFELDKCRSKSLYYLECKSLYESDITGSYRHHKYIMNFLKQIDANLYGKLLENEMIKEDERQSKRESVLSQQYDYKLHDLFYNPNFLRFLLPEEFGIKDTKFLVQIEFMANPSSYFPSIYFGKSPSIDNFFKIDFIPYDDRLFKIEYAFYNRRNCFVSMPLSNFLYGNYYETSDDSNSFYKEKLIILFKEHKELIMKCIFEEIKKHVEKVKKDNILNIENIEEGERLIMERILMEDEINKTKGVQTNNSLYDIFLVDYADQYFSDLRN